MHRYINHFCVVLACKEFILELLAIRVLIEIGLRGNGLCQSSTGLLHLKSLPAIGTGPTPLHAWMDIDMVRTMSKVIIYGVGGIVVRNL